MWCWRSCPSTSMLQPIVSELSPYWAFPTSLGRLGLSLIYLSQARLQESTGEAGPPGHTGYPVQGDDSLG